MAIYTKIFTGHEKKKPAKQDLQPVWAVLRKHLGIDPSRVEDRDLQEIMSGQIVFASGMGALRTHASSAHGAGKRSYKLEQRHGRLAVHAAHTLVLFLLESWSKKKGAVEGLEPTTSEPVPSITRQGNIRSFECSALYPAELHRTNYFTLQTHPYI